MSAKSSQLQIRVSAEQKRQLRRSATRLGISVSEYVLSRALPEPRRRFEELVALLRNPEERRFAFAAVNDLLAELSGPELERALEAGDGSGLDDHTANYLAAMVERASDQKGVDPPPWIRRIEPLKEPHFASDLAALRPHLLLRSPVPFRRRNLFVDASVGDRV